MDKLLITDYLDQTAARLPDKTAFADDECALTFGQLRDAARKIGTALIRKGASKQPVAIKIDKSPRCVAAMMGVAYAGCFYTVIDIDMPKARTERIMNVLKPVSVIDDEAYEAYMREEPDECLLAERRKTTTDSDVLYVLFTSGSTGDPKGVVVSQKAVIAYLEWGASVFQFDDTAVYGNQTPFYFVMSGMDIFHTIRGGGTTWIIPTELFSFPVRLLEYIRDRHINTLYWVPSALCIVANFRALPEVHLPELRLVNFSGEVMPAKQLNMWVKEYPDVVFANLYGPTEMTDVCAYHIIDRHYENKESLPIGRACSHMELMVLDEDGRQVAPGEEGELCGRGPSLAYGYYNNPEATDKSFVQNPLQKAYYEKIYRTGDLVRQNERGELVYICRKDYQIKHLGHRIELGEIETAVSSVEGVDENACLYDEKRSRILCYYTGRLEQEALGEALKELLPDYMLPAKRVNLSVMPRNLNGKIDRKALREGV